MLRVHVILNAENDRVDRPLKSKLYRIVHEWKLIATSDVKRFPGHYAV